MTTNRYWLKEVADARELIEHSNSVDYAFVGVLRAKAIVAVEEELRELRRQCSKKSEGETKRG
jgi:hypothetical protein